MNVLPRMRLSANVLSPRVALWLVLGAITVGTLGLMGIEGMSLTDAFYMTVITISTVGYGEVAPLSTAGRWFVSGLIVLNLGIVAYALAVFSSYVIDGKIFKQMQEARIQKHIRKLRGHTIVCGYGRYGQEIVDHLLLHDADFVVIEEQDERLERLLERHPAALYVQGDATNDADLFEANIEEAASLITALKDDSDNLFIVLSARDLNPGMRVISSARNTRSRQKLIKAGASNVILPEQIGGFYMATLISKPGAVEFFSFITNELAADIGFEEVTYEQLPDRFRGQPIADLALRANTGVNIIGHRLPGGKYRVNPGADTVLEPGASYIAIGNQTQLRELRTYFSL